MNNDNLKSYFDSLPEVKRIKELEEEIDNNAEIKARFNELKRIQRKMVSSKEFNQKNQYELYLDLYETKKEELLAFPNLEEYLNLLEYVDSLLVKLTKEIEVKLDKKING